MLRVLPPTFNLLTTGWNNAQHRYSTRFPVIKQVARFLLPVFPYLNNETGSR